jgi:hypothetical protein
MEKEKREEKEKQSIKSKLLSFSFDCSGKKIFYLMKSIDWLT